MKQIIKASSAELVQSNDHRLGNKGTYIAYRDYQGTVFVLVQLQTKHVFAALGKGTWDVFMAPTVSDAVENAIGDGEIPFLFESQEEFTQWMSQP